MCCPSIFNCQRSKASAQKPGVKTHGRFRLLDPAALEFREYRIRGIHSRKFLVSRAHSGERINSHVRIRERLVGLGRVELPTSPLSGVRSSQLSYRPGRSHSAEHRTQTGGAGRDRTGDLLNANQALSQLSYSPWSEIRDWGLGNRHDRAKHQNPNRQPRVMLSRPIGRCWPAPGRTNKVSRRT